MSNVQLKQQVTENVEPTLLKKVHQLGQESASLFEKRFLERKKSGLVAFLLSLFTLHRFYYGQAGLAVLQILTCFMGGVGYLWIIYDWFNMKKDVGKLNEDIAVDIYRQVSV